MKKSIFITGASSGIGKGTAKFFHEKGWNVIATMRKPEKENELDQLENVHLLPLDVTDLDQIDKTVQEAIDLHPIDVVLNNAGYGTMGPLEGTTDQEIQDIINTNLLGVIRLTKAFFTASARKRKWDHYQCYLYWRSGSLSIFLALSCQ